MMENTSERISFYKMHGAGNDFVVFDSRQQKVLLTAAKISALADRNRSIGFDQLVILEQPTHPEGDVMVRFFNTDGSESAACGNASRCVVRLLHKQNGKNSFTLQTRAGLLPAFYKNNAMIEVNMGIPRFGWNDIPLAYECDTNHLPLEGDPAGVSMGNPHMTFFVKNIQDVNITELGPFFEHVSLFSQGANVGFAEMVAPDTMRLRVWERGSGLTLACGSGACAAVANAIRRGVAEKTCRVELDGGMLFITQTEKGEMLMTGPAVLAYEGVVDVSELG